MGDDLERGKRPLAESGQTRKERLQACWDGGDGQHDRLGSEGPGTRGPARIYLGGRIRISITAACFDTYRGREETKKSLDKMYRTEGSPKDKSAVKDEGMIIITLLPIGLRELAHSLS